MSTFWWYQTRYSSLPSFLPQAPPLLARTNLIIVIKAHHLHVTDLVKKIVEFYIFLLIIFINFHHLHHISSSSCENLVKKIVNKMMMMMKKKKKIMTHFIHTSNFTYFAHHFHHVHKIPSSSCDKSCQENCEQRRRRFMTHFTPTLNFTLLLFKWIPTSPNITLERGHG